jgi:4-hydroxy-tetrahydrodipicolinate synthase
VTVPAFVRPSEEGVLAHFAALAAASPVPLIVYHVPYRTGRPLGTGTVRALAALPNVAGIKWAVGGIDQGTVELLADPPPGFAILAGDDAFAPALLALGAPGAVLASAHLATGDWAALAASAARGAYDAGLGHRLTRLAAACFAEPNPAVVKAVLHARGRLPDPGVRLPLLPAGRPARETALRALAATGDTRQRNAASARDRAGTRIGENG